MDQNIETIQLGDEFAKYIEESYREFVEEQEFEEEFERQKAEWFSKNPR